MNSSPANPEAEAAVLGAALHSPEAARLALDSLTPDAFTDPACRAVFEAIEAVDEAGATPDPIVVADAARRAGTIERIGGHLALVRLLEGVPVVSHIGHYVGIVADYAARRRAIAEHEAAAAKAADLTVPFDGSPIVAATRSSWDAVDLTALMTGDPPRRSGGAA